MPRDDNEVSNPSIRYQWALKIPEKALDLAKNLKNEIFVFSVVYIVFFVFLVLLVIYLTSDAILSGFCIVAMLALLWIILHFNDKNDSRNYNISMEKLRNESENKVKEIVGDEE